MTEEDEFDMGAIIYTIVYVMIIIFVLVLAVPLKPIITIIAILEIINRWTFSVKLSKKIDRQVE